LVAIIRLAFSCWKSRAFGTVARIPLAQHKLLAVVLARTRLVTLNLYFRAIRMTIVRVRVTVHSANRGVYSEARTRLHYRVGR